jgi:hypothetical protein
MMPIRKQQVVPALVLVFLLAAGMAGADEKQAVEDGAAERKAHVSQKLSATVKARPEFVWSSIHEARTKYPGLVSAKVISEDERGSVFEQQFVVPFLGDSTSRFALSDSPPNRVDYKLLDSNIFSVMDGSWILASELGGRSTSVEVSCHITAKRILPKWLLKMMLERKLAKQLDFVKTTAESKETEAEAAEKKK